VGCKAVTGWFGPVDETRGNVGRLPVQALALDQRKRRLEHVVVADLGPDALKPWPLLGLDTTGADHEHVFLGRRADAPGTKDRAVHMAVARYRNPSTVRTAAQFPENRGLCAACELTH